MDRRNLGTMVWLRWLAPVMLVLIALTAFSGSTPTSAAVAEPASLVLNVYTCESRNDPIDPTESLIDQCRHGTEDIPFALDMIPAQGGGAMASTGTGGAPATISFTGLVPGDYRLVQQTPATIARSYIATCTSTARTFDYPFSPFAIIEPGGRLNIQLLPGETLVCDWYNVQAESEPAAALTITTYSCSGDTLDPDDCDLAPNIEFTVTSATGTSQQITSDNHGVATFDGTGAYHLEATTTLENRDFCSFVPSSAVAGADLVLDPATPLAIDAYYCYPGA